MKKVENIVAKVEIPCFEQFLLLSHCFQKLSAAGASECVYIWERVKNKPAALTSRVLAQIPTDQLSFCHNVFNTVQ